jgi:hypothetical protein
MSNFNDFHRKVSPKLRDAYCPLRQHLNRRGLAWLPCLICLIKPCFIQRIVRLTNPAEPLGSPPPLKSKKGMIRNGITLALCCRGGSWIFPGRGICLRWHFPSRIVLRGSVLCREVQRTGGRGMGAQQGRYRDRNRGRSPLPECSSSADNSNRPGNVLKWARSALPC